MARNSELVSFLIENKGQANFGCLHEWVDTDSVITLEVVSKVQTLHGMFSSQLELDFDVMLVHQCGGKEVNLEKLSERLHWVAKNSVCGGQNR